MASTAQSEQPVETDLPDARIVFAPDSPIVEVLKTCRRIAGSNATVLLGGETGTGKEIFARFIHEHSPRAGRPLVALNCAAIPEALLESELFGHVRGAFTGAVHARRGRIAAAEGGTLFLDEIGEMPLALQAKLLRVLQERTYEPVGATEQVEADFRLIVATHRDLAAEVEAGRFRRDLYYRLLVCPVDVPPLRQRPSDVARLFNHFWIARGEKRTVAPEVLDALRQYPWPGNVRELENLVERLSVCVAGETIQLADLPPSLLPHDAVATPSPALRVVGPEARPARTPVPAPAVPPRAAPTPPPSREAAAATPSAADPQGATSEPLRFVEPDLFNFEEQTIDLPRILRRIEDGYIDAALRRTQGNRKAAADLLGLQRTTLVEKLRRRQRDASTP